MSAATRLARLLPLASITVFERSSNVSYANCGLPYFVGDVIAKKDDLLLQTPSSLTARFGLDVKVNTEVTGIDPLNKTISYTFLPTGQVSSLHYDSLILSTGAAPFIPPIPGISRALTLRTVEDAAALKDQALSLPTSALIMGAGFVGLEIAENLVRRGIPTTIVEASPQVLPPLDPEMAHLVSKELLENGVALRLGVSVKEILSDRVVLSTGELLPAALVVSAVGVRPDVSLARLAGLELGLRGGIEVDQTFRTSDPSIYAIGDAVEKSSPYGPTLVPLANIANRQGRLVADHLAGLPVNEASPTPTSIIQVFSLAAATTGANEKQLVATTTPYLAIHTHPMSHASYYPGAQPMALKLLVDPSSHRILGAQAVGSLGVDKRIDVIATAMQSGLPAPALAELSLAYAPPFSSAKDPVNLLGYIAENRLTGLTPAVSSALLDSPPYLDYQLLDVRTRSEFNQSHIPGALNIPVDELRDRLDEVPERVIVYCRVGARAHVAQSYLRSLGYDAISLDGGILTYEATRFSSKNYAAPPLAPVLSPL